jgi:hypothetical protein
MSSCARANADSCTPSGPMSNPSSVVQTTFLSKIIGTLNTYRLFRTSARFLGLASLKKVAGDLVCVIY